MLLLLLSTMMSFSISHVSSGNGNKHTQKPACQELRRLPGYFRQSAAVNGLRRRGMNRTAMKLSTRLQLPLFA
jgi:hypothetical protein